MPVISYDLPDRFVAGTVGPPGERTFFLQAREGRRVVSVALEKQQVIALAERLDQLLDELMKADTRGVVPAVAPLDLEDADPLESPIEEEFRAGTMTLSWDPETERVVIEVFPYSEAAVVAPDQLEEDFEEDPVLMDDGRTMRINLVPILKGVIRPGGRIVCAGPCVSERARAQRPCQFDGMSLVM